MTTSTLGAALPALMAAVGVYNDAVRPPLRVIGLGSSVGVGVSLPNPAVDAPAPYFAVGLARAVNQLGNMTMPVTNGSVYGSVIASGTATDYAAAKTAAGGVPAVVPLAYGMNEGTPGQYHGQTTLPGVYTTLRALTALIEADGADVVVMTTPHPHSTRYPWTDPAVGTYPGGATFIPALTAAASVVAGDWSGSGVIIPASYRHLRVNQQLRRAAYDLGLPLIDVERYWFKAVAAHGEDALYDAGQYVHPNLLGHQQSYHLAIDDFFAVLTEATVSNGMPAAPLNWQPLTLAAGWAPFGSGYLPPSYAITKDGVKHLAGVVKNVSGATVPAGTRFATLTPAAYPTPAGTRMASTVSGAGPNRLQVDTGISFPAIAIANGDFVGLDGITYV
jgi:hypothetical protein